MTQINMIKGGVCAAIGFKASGVHCGIRQNKLKKDLALISAEKNCNAAAVYTKNKVKGAPITVTMENLKDGKAQAIICNSGNANTCAPNGIEVAEQTCALLGKELGIDAKDVIIASTGVIGEKLSLEPFKIGIPKLVKKLKSETSGSLKAAQAIMTTDRVEKECAVSFFLSNKQCHLGGIAKGSGMVNPNMATMLCFLTTDVAISSEMLRKALLKDIEGSFNQLYVDGDTSTNDMVSILASGCAENEEITAEGPEFEQFCAALATVTNQLCKKLAKDAEGAGKLIECIVSGAPDLKTARSVSKSVVGSTLLKAAIFGEDANWGRILCAIGYTDAEFDISKVDVVLSSKYGNVEVCKKATYNPFSEKIAAKVLSADEIGILISLNQGESSASAWGCDLTYEYVKINGEYRS